MKKNIAVNELGQVVFGSVARFGVRQYTSGFMGVSVEYDKKDGPSGERPKKSKSRHN